MKEENIQLGIKRDALLESNHKQLEKIEKFKKKKKKYRGNERRGCEKSGRIEETD